MSGERTTWSQRPNSNKAKTVVETQPVCEGRTRAIVLYCVRKKPLLPSRMAVATVIYGCSKGVVFICAGEGR